jgi:tetratricopeptide (TPR) repeat protein
MSKRFLIFLFVTIIVCSSNYGQEQAEDLLSDAVDILANQPEQALEMLDKAFSIADKNKNPGLVADILRRKANCYFFMSDYETALEYNNKALTIRDSDIFSQDDSVNIAEKANIYYNIAIINQFLENYFEAIKFALKLEPLYRKIADDSKLGYRCYNLTAKLYYQIGDIANAQLYALKELEIMESINDNISLSYTLDFLAMLKQSQNQLDECLDLQYKSLKIRNSIGDSVLISYSYNNIGSSLLIKEDLRRALDYFYKSLKIKLKYDDIYNIAPTYNNLGYTYQKMNDYDKCLEYYLKSYNFNLQKNDKYGLVTSATNLGNLYVILKKEKDAESYFMEAYDISVANGYKSHIYTITGHLSELYGNIGDYKNAFKMLNLNTLYRDSTHNDDIIKKLSRMEVEYEFRRLREQDSIKQAELNLKKKLKYNIEIRKKEQASYIILIISLVILFLAIILFKRYQSKKKNRETELKQKALEVEKNLLRSQMNPHFIFNAMNSIQSFIASNDEYSAERFLSRFAKLMRLILENSMHQYICLENEISSIRLYLELEQMRFNNKFDFSINIDDEIDEENSMVPPMLIQPFVENAIIHGIMHKQGKGKIIINIFDCENEKCLICEVVDNGIGREEAARLKEESGIKHKSVGMQLTRDRIQSINRESGFELAFNITDIIENGKPAGTKAEIFLPVKYNF